MQFTYLIVAIAPLISTVVADLHNAAVCVTARKFTPIGGTPFSPSQTWAKDFEIMVDATKCACDLYKLRNTGNKQHDVCPDCTFDGLQCTSAGYHIGGDEMTYYCEEKCHAHGAEGSPS